MVTRIKDNIYNVVILQEAFILLWEYLKRLERTRKDDSELGRKLFT